MSHSDTLMMSLVEDQCRALRRLRGSATDMPPAPPCMDVEDAIICALRGLLPHISPGPKLFYRVLLSDTGRALSTLFECHGVDPYLALARDGHMSLSETIKRGHWELLSILHRSGFDLSAYHDGMLKHAFRHGDAGYTHFIRETLGDTRSLLCVLHIAALADQPPEAFVDEVARDITAEFRNPESEHIADMLRMVLPQGFSLKLFALQLMSGRDLTLTNGRYLDRIGPPVSNLVRKTGSRHGRLELSDLEPCLASVLRRSPQDTFFGISEKTYQAALHDKTS